MELRCFYLPQYFVDVTIKCYFSLDSVYRCQLLANYAVTLHLAYGRYFSKIKPDPLQGQSHKHIYTFSKPDSNLLCFIFLLAQITFIQ